MRYSAKERLIAKLLTSFPQLKRIIKYTYQRFNLLRFRKEYSFKTHLKIHKLSNNLSDNSFFGYYDRSPMSMDGKHIVFHSTDFDTRQKPKKCKEIDIVLYEVQSGQTKTVSKTKAFNWQQGAKLQWINNDEFIFNDYSNERNTYVSKIYSISKKQFTLINSPIYDVFNNYALTLNYDRLAQLRPDYGYFAKSQLPSSFNCNQEGIRFVNLTENTSKLIISIDRIIQSHFQKSMIDADHLVNHIMISPNGDNFIFLHRWFCNGVRNDALMLSDKMGTKLKCISDNQMVSHCFWKNNQEVVGYMRGIDQQDQYLQINIDSLETIKLEVLNKFGDGHPHINENVLITDTYPNKSRMKELLVYDFDLDKLKNIGEFFESFNFYGETRCDLHPRISYDKNYFFFDSVHEGKRHLYMIKND